MVPESAIVLNRSVEPSLTAFTCEPRANRVDDGGIGIKYTKKQIDALPITRHDFHGEWNYTITPTPTDTPTPT